MATLGGNNPTLLDWASMRDPDGKIAQVVPVLEQTLEMIKDASVIEGNLETGHQVTAQISLPTVNYKLLNGGTTPSKGTTAQTTEQAAIMEAWSNVDEDIAELGGNVSAYRAQIASTFLEAMAQKFGTTVVYGNAGTDPEQFTGLAPRFNTLGQNVISGGGSGSDNTSIWLIGWHPMCVSLFFPKGTQAGLVHEDKGKRTVTITAGAAGSLGDFYQDKFKWKHGLAIMHPGYVVRGCNIDVSNLIAESSPADLVKLILKMVHRIPMRNKPGMRLALYMNRTVYEWLDIQRFNNAEGSGLTYPMVDGIEIPHFRGIPLRIHDSITLAEATVA